MDSMCTLTSGLVGKFCSVSNKQALFITYTIIHRTTCNNNTDNNTTTNNTFYLEAPCKTPKDTLQ